MPTRYRASFTAMANSVASTMACQYTLEKSGGVAAMRAQSSGPCTTGCDQLECSENSNSQPNNVAVISGPMLDQNTGSESATKSVLAISAIADCTAYWASIHSWRSVA